MSARRPQSLSGFKLRAAILMTIVSLAFTALAGRLVQLHAFRSEELRAEASQNQQQVVQWPGRRGEIRDCNGNLLANSQSVRIVCADPSITSNKAPVIAARLAPLLQLNVLELEKRLSGSGQYVRLKQKVDEETARQIRELKLRGIMMEDQFLRTYPHGELGSHVLGYVNHAHRGEQGVERSFNQYLEGVAGHVVIERDRKGREIRANRLGGLAPRDGHHVVLTIDQVIQHIAETELDKAMAEHRPQGGLIIVTRPKTGEILAMSSRPTYDPNQPGTAPADARRNRCISDVAEPGSTFKVVSIVGALSDGIVRPSDVIFCENGAWLFARRMLHDAHPHGNLSVEDVVVKSSNIGSAKIAVRMGAPRLHEYIQRFGFGRRTGITLPGEVAGTAHPLSRWSGLSISRIPMGHEIDATALQMIMAVNAVANGGRLMKPLLVKQVINDEGQVVLQNHPVQVAQTITPQASALMTRALGKVPTPEGTAPRAAVEGYDVAGKTGTAQKLENGQYVRKYYSSFIGYLPAQNPEISILVSLDNPSVGGYYGGTVAGPTFKRVAEKVVEYLGVHPTRPLNNSKQVAKAS